MTLASIDTTSELAVSDYLAQCRDWLATCVEMTGPEQIAAAKAEIATAAEATKQLGLSKEIQLDAQEMVRRAEYALGKAIRKGQEEGRIGGDHGGDRRSSAASGLGRPTDFAGKRELYGSDAERPGILAVADAPADNFDAAIGAAKAEGNLSRANVARKAREASAAPARTLPRPEAEKSLNLLAMYAEKAAREAQKLTPDQIRRVTPKADLWTVGLGESLETLQRLLTSLTEEK